MPDILAPPKASSGGGGGLDTAAVLALINAANHVEDRGVYVDVDAANAAQTWPATEPLRAYTSEGVALFALAGDNAFTEVTQPEIVEIADGETKPAVSGDRVYIDNGGTVQLPADGWVTLIEPGGVTWLTGAAGPQVVPQPGDTLQTGVSWAGGEVHLERLDTGEWQTRTETSSSAPIAWTTVTPGADVLSAAAGTLYIADVGDAITITPTGGLATGSKIRAYSRDANGITFAAPVVADDSTFPSITSNNPSSGVVHDVADAFVEYELQADGQWTSMPLSNWSTAVGTGDGTTPAPAFATIEDAAANTFDATTSITVTLDPTLQLGGGHVNTDEIGVAGLASAAAALTNVDVAHLVAALASTGTTVNGVRAIVFAAQDATNTGQRTAIVGGESVTNGGNRAVTMGGFGANIPTGVADSATIGGVNLTITANTGFVGGGATNSVHDIHSAVVAGEQNSVVDGTQSAWIAGQGNQVDESSAFTRSAGLGGSGNRIRSAESATLGGRDLQTQSYGQVVMGRGNKPQGTSTDISVNPTDLLMMIGNEQAAGVSNAIGIQWDGTQQLFDPQTGSAGDPPAAPSDQTVPARAWNHGLEWRWIPSATAWERID